MKSIAWVKRVAAERLASFRPMPRQAVERMRLDRSEGALGEDPGPERAVSLCVAWLKRCQDQSRPPDGGAARHFSLITGWSESYPETSGYIVPSLLAACRWTGDNDLRERAHNMLSWLVSIQFPEGGFQGGTITAEPRVPVTFNTGQILIGLASGAKEFGQPFLDAANTAADWLVDSIDPDGCWRRFPTPFASAGEKAYETHVSWGLLVAAEASGRREFLETAVKNVDWALTKQRANGWLADCCLEMPDRPLTHTLAYALRGIIETYRSTREVRFLEAAEKFANGAMQSIEANGRLAGRLDREWRPAVDYACLTGSVQFASCFFILHHLTANAAYQQAARKLNSFVRRTLIASGSPDQVGGVRGSFPIDGAYGSYEFLNWGAKFCVDSNLHELGMFGSYTL